jgi:RNase P protein component
MSKGEDYTHKTKATSNFVTIIRRIVLEAFQSLHSNMIGKNDVIIHVKKLASVTNYQT